MDRFCIPSTKIVPIIFKFGFTGVLEKRVLRELEAAEEAKEAKKEKEKQEKLEYEQKRAEKLEKEKAERELENKEKSEQNGDDLTKENTPDSETEPSTASVPSEITPTTTTTLTGMN